MADESMSELMEEFNDLHGRTEGREGLKNLCRLVRALGYKSDYGQMEHDCSIGDLMEFLEDNSGAIDALKEWIVQVNVPEWKENILTILPEKEEPHIQVEYDLNFYGGDYDKTGEFAYIKVSLTENKTVEEAFKEVTGHDPVHIIHYCPDEHYSEDGEILG